MIRASKSSASSESRIGGTSKSAARDGLLWILTPFFQLPHNLASFTHATPQNESDVLTWNACGYAQGVVEVLWKCSDDQGLRT